MRRRSPASELSGLERAGNAVGQSTSPAAGERASRERAGLKIEKNFFPFL